MKRTTAAGAAAVPIVAGFRLVPAGGDEPDVVGFGRAPRRLALVAGACGAEKPA